MKTPSSTTIKSNWVDIPITWHQSLAITVAQLLHHDMQFLELCLPFPILTIIVQMMPIPFWHMAKNEEVTIAAKQYKQHPVTWKKLGPII